jgi:hypothetical protein
MRLLAYCGGVLGGVLVYFLTTDALAISLAATHHAGAWPYVIALAPTGILLAGLAPGRVAGWPVAALAAAMAAIAVVTLPDSEAARAGKAPAALLVLSLGLALGGIAVALANRKPERIAAAMAFAVGFAAGHTYERGADRPLTAPLALLLASALIAIAALAVRMGWPGSARIDVQPLVLLLCVATTLAVTGWWSRTYVDSPIYRYIARHTAIGRGALHLIVVGSLMVLVSVMVATASRGNGPTEARWIAAMTSLGALASLFVTGSDRSTLLVGVLAIGGAVAGAGLARVVAKVPWDAVALAVAAIGFWAMSRYNATALALLTALGMAVLGAALVPAATNAQSPSALLAGLGGFVAAIALLSADAPLRSDPSGAGRHWLVPFVGIGALVTAWMARRHAKSP